MKTITCCSFKGGTGKTSIAIHLATGLAKFHKKRVLVIDLDPQGNLSMGLGLETMITSVEAIMGDWKHPLLVQDTNTPSCQAIAASPLLDGIERNPLLAADAAAHYRLKAFLETIADSFDFCLIDTPPSLGWLPQTAFLASSGYLVCLTPDAYSLLALARLKEFHQAFSCHHRVELVGVAFSLWDDRGALNAPLQEEVAAIFPKAIFTTKIRRDISIPRAVFKSQTVYESDPKSRATADYKSLCKEFLRKTKKLEPELHLARGCHG